MLHSSQIVRNETKLGTDSDLIAAGKIAFWQFDADLNLGGNSQLGEALLMVKERLMLH